MLTIQKELDGKVIWKKEKRKPILVQDQDQESEQHPSFGGHISKPLAVSIISIVPKLVSWCK